MEPRKMTLEQLDREQVVHLKKENEKLIERISELEAQVKWTKFDPSKVNTYPPKEMFLAWGLPSPDYGGSPTWFVCWRNSYGFSCDESAYPEVLYWRPPPNPPVESNCE